MKSVTRIQLSTAVSANAFLQEHPDPSTGGKAMADQLAQLIAHAEALAQQQHAGQATSTAATTRRSELRDQLFVHFRSLVEIARTASKSEPGITLHFRIPRGRPNDTTLLALGRAGVAEALEHKDQLTALGMPDALLEQMTAELDEFAREGIRQRQSIAAHVGAGAELGAVMKELLAHLKHIDALQRLRFRDQPELAAAWKSARNVPYPVPAKGTTVGPSGPVKAA